MTKVITREYRFTTRECKFTGASHPIKNSRCPVSRIEHLYCSQRDLAYNYRPGRKYKNILSSINLDPIHDEMVIAYFSGKYSRNNHCSLSEPISRIKYAQRQKLEYIYIYPMS